MATTPGPAAPKFVFDFSEGNKDLKDLLGGKGANLAEMTNLGLPVPPGFTITTEACRRFLDSGAEPLELRAQVTRQLAALEERMGKRLGQPDDPLLVAVRSGSKFSMPGMMDTILDIGLNDDSVRGLAKQSGDERFALDSYRRLLQMFGRTVLGIDGEPFETALNAAKRAKGATTDLDLDAADLDRLVRTYSAIISEHSGREFPQDPREQLDLAIRAVFASWNSPRATVYRRRERIPADLGTAVNVCAMVFGNLGEDSGSGVAFTRDPASGAPGIYGDYLPNAQGEDVVAGIRNTVSLHDLQHRDPRSYRQLMDNMTALESHYRDLCDIEFTIERGKLWMLQTRVGKRTPQAAFRIATQLVDEGLISLDEAMSRVTGDQLAQLMFPRFDGDAAKTRVTKGINASPGAAVGKAVFSAAAAVRAKSRGDDVILIRRETSPDDLDGMLAAAGVLTSRGGKTSHAAVVARGLGKPCVCGAEALGVDHAAMTAGGPGGVTIREADVVSIDGSTGEVFLGAVPVVPSLIGRYFEGELDQETVDSDDLLRSVQRLVRHADRRRRLGVRANADTPADAERARRMGAQGIGLCRTEHMFLGERSRYVEDLILATALTGAEDGVDRRDRALAALEPLQKADFIEILEAMDVLPVTVRLIDPPLHEFLPDLTELAVRVAIAERAGTATAHDQSLLAAVRRLHEHNPMLGMRGVRLGIVIPGLFAMQVRAVAEAAAERILAGGRPRPEIMIPLVAAAQEFTIVGDQAQAAVREVAERYGVDLDIPIGTMIELPRAAVTAGEIAEAAEFFSFGTNDLTQTVWGLSRDDAETSFLAAYLDHDVFRVSPFESLDLDGVGRLVKIAVDQGRATRPGLALGVCGEHGGDPDSIHFFAEIGLDYVSCSPFRLPIARLEAGRAAIRAKT